jgi:hypothetical protein
LTEDVSNDFPAGTSDAAPRDAPVLAALFCGVALLLDLLTGIGEGWVAAFAVPVVNT